MQPGKLNLAYAACGTLDLAYKAKDAKSPFMLGNVSAAPLLPPAPQQLSLANRSQSATGAGPAAPLPPASLRRMRSEPPPGTASTVGQRFTDRLLLLLTREISTTPVQLPVVTIGFGQDPPPRTGASSAPAKCSICLEDKASTVQLCWNNSCEDRFCEECIAPFAKEAVDRAVYAVPWLHCPGCSGRLPTSSWATLAPEAFATYKSHADAMMNFRCSECHETGTLCIEKTRGPSAIDKLGEKDALCKNWGDFGSAISTAESFLSTFKDKDVELVLSCIEDLERRTCLHLAWLRSNPFIVTPCCDTEFCFKCKVGSHHDGQSCEERQREELDVFCQFCPDCEVPTVRTEGCDHIVCVCGAEWTWQEVAELGWALGPVRHLRELLRNGTLDANWKNAEEDDMTLLMSAAGAGLMENLKALMEAGADVMARNGQGGLINYAMGVDSGTFSPEMVELLLESKAFVDKDDPFLWMSSCRTNNAQAVEMFDRLLMLSEVKANDVDKQGESFIEIAAKRSRSTLVEFLLKKEVPVSDKVPFLFITSTMRDKALFDRILTASGITVDCLDKSGKGMVAMCMDRGGAGMADFLVHLVVKHGAKSTFKELARPHGNIWPQDSCVINIDVFDALVKQGADPWLMDLSEPVRDPWAKPGWLLKLILNAWHNGQSHPPRRRTPIEAHVGKLLERMLSQWGPSADLVAKSPTGASYLSQAMHLQRFNLARRLIEAGAGLDAPCTEFGCGGLLPLVSAAKHGAVDMMELLLEAKADVLAADQTAAMALTKKSLSQEGLTLLQRAVDEALMEREERARKMAHSGDGSIQHVGMKLDGHILCSDCRQRFDSDKALSIHWRFIHDPSRHQED